MWAPIFDIVAGLAVWFGVLCQWQTRNRRFVAWLAALTFAFAVMSAESSPVVIALRMAIAVIAGVTALWPDRFGLSTLPQAEAAFNELLGSIVRAVGETRSKGGLEIPSVSMDVLAQVGSELQALRPPTLQWERVVDLNRLYNDSLVAAPDPGGNPERRWAFVAARRVWRDVRDRNLLFPRRTPDRRRDFEIDLLRHHERFRGATQREDVTAANQYLDRIRELMPPDADWAAVRDELVAMLEIERPVGPAGRSESDIVEHDRRSATLTDRWDQLTSATETEGHWSKGRS